MKFPLNGDGNKLVCLSQWLAVIKVKCIWICYYYFISEIRICPEFLSYKNHANLISILFQCNFLKQYHPTITYKVYVTQNKKFFWFQSHFYCISAQNAYLTQSHEQCSANYLFENCKGSHCIHCNSSQWQRKEER